MVKQPRVLLLLDGSSSMLQSWQGNQTRFAAADVLIQRLMDSVYAVDPKVEFGLRVYGHQFPYPQNNCFDTRREVAFSKNNRTQMELRLAALQPSGVSPIAYSLLQAAEEDLIDEKRYSYSVILITDGGESCNGDLCAVARELEQRSIFFKPYIISLVDYAPLAQQYKCLGTYLTVTRKTDLPSAIGQIVEAYRPALKLLAKGEKPLPTVTLAPVNSPTPVVVPVIPKPVVEAPKPVVVVPKPVVVIPKPVPVLKPVVEAPKPVVVVPDPVVVIPKPVVEAPKPVVVRQPELPVPPLKVKLTPRLLPDTQYVRIGKTEWLIPTLQLPAREDLPEVPPLTHVLRRARVPQIPEPRVQDRLRTIPTLPRPQREPEPAVAVATPPPVVPPPAPTPVPKPMPKPKLSTTPAVKEAAFTVTSEPAAKSGIEVFFTDGKGKFYKSTPQMQVLKAKGNATVKKFYRTVGPDGNPDLQELSPGTYDLVVLSKTSVVARNVTVAANEKKKVVITLSNGSLSFSYATAPDRPIKEFEANVVRRFASDNTIVKQPASEERYYEPGTYYVELNTLPVTRRSLEIDLGGTTEVLIPEPGWCSLPIPPLLKAR